MDKHLNKTTQELSTKNKSESQSYNTLLEKAIKKIIKKYGVMLVSCIINIQGTADVQLDHNTYYKEQEKMENEIRNLGLINDIYYRYRNVD